MSPDQIRFLRQILGLSPVDLARALRISPVTVYRWEAGKNPPTGLSLEVLRALHGVAVCVEGDPKRTAIISGEIALGVGALIHRLLVQEAERRTSAP